MVLSDESGLFSLGGGCPVHGDEGMIECTMCGVEFCRACFPKSAMCADCASQEEGDDEEDAPDFEDVQHLDDLLEEDEEIEKILKESESDLPPDELMEDDEEDEG